MESTKVKGYRFLAFVEGFFGCLEVRNICFLLGEAKNIFFWKNEVEVTICYLLFVVVVVLVGDGGGGWCSWWGIRNIRNWAHGESFCKPTAHSKFICEVLWPLSREPTWSVFFQWWEARTANDSCYSVSLFPLRGDWEGLTKCNKNCEFWHKNETEAKSVYFIWRPTTLEAEKSLLITLAKEFCEVEKHTYTDIFRMGKTLTFSKCFMLQLTIA